MRVTRSVAGVSLAVVVALAFGGWWRWRDDASGQIQTSVIAASGRLEGTTLRVGSETAGRVVRLMVARGAVVERADTIAVLDDRRLAAAVDAARADAAAAEAAVMAESDGAFALEPRAALARRDAERYRRLFEDDAVSRQAVDRAETERQSLARQVDAAHAAHRLAARRAEAANANVRRLEIELGETVVRAPVAGVISAVVTREGEVVAAGAPVIALLAAEPMDLRVYLPLDVAGRIAIGMEARVYVEAFPKDVFAGRVQHIASDAEFTPKDVHMPDERTSLVYAVDIRVANPGGRLKDGFPADAHIRIDPTADWPEGPPW